VGVFSGIVCCVWDVDGVLCWGPVGVLCGRVVMGLLFAWVVVGWVECVGVVYGVLGLGWWCDCCGFWLASDWMRFLAWGVFGSG